MMYSNAFFKQLGHLNPTVYNYDFQHEPIAQMQPPAAGLSGGFQFSGSVFAADFSGELHLLSNFTWKMKNLTKELRAIINQSKQSNYENNIRVLTTIVCKMVSYYCDLGTKRIGFAPKPYWFTDAVTIEEKVSAAALIAHAATVVKGAELKTSLKRGAEKILEAALVAFTDAPHYTLKTSHN